MKGINKVIILGTLGQDPEIRHMQNGDPVANLSIATSESWNDKTTGEKKEKTEWHRVVIFGKTAEIAQQYLSKGSQVYIEGQLQTRKWTDSNGVEKYTTEIVIKPFVGAMQLVGSKPAQSNTQSTQSVQNEPISQTNAQQDNFTDDIPF